MGGLWGGGGLSGRFVRGLWGGWKGLWGVGMFVGEKVYERLRIDFLVCYRNGMLVEEFKGWFDCGK